jgi:hypothetical protein
MKHILCAPDNAEGNPLVPLDLPPQLRTYFEASNAHDADLMLSAFSPGASVRDEGEEMIGLAAIRAWAEATFRKYDTTITPQSVDREDHSIVVTAAVSGAFPGSPIQLGFAFRTADGKIAALKIG